MASCSPVLAPLGTAARAMMPDVRNSSASTVGLPRLSRISRAMILSIVAGILFLSFSFGSDCMFGGLHAVQTPHFAGHLRPDALHQLGAVVVREAAGRNGLEEMYMYGARPDEERTLRHH